MPGMLRTRKSSEQTDARQDRHLSDRLAERRPAEADAAFTTEGAMEDAARNGYAAVERGRRMPTDTDGSRAHDRNFFDGVEAGVYLVPGDPDGCIDFQAITDRLKAIGYSGWIDVEAAQDPAKAQTYEYFKLGYEHIIEISGRSGLTIER